MKPSVVLFETSVPNLNRYVKYLVDEIVKSNEIGKIWIVIEPYNDANLVTYFDDRIGPIDSRDMTKNWIITNKVCAFVSFSYRVPDLFWTNRFRLAGVTTLQIQHGMYAEFLKRSKEGFTGRLFKNLVYIKYLIKASLETNSLTNFKYLINKDIFQNPQTIENLTIKVNNDALSSALTSDFVFTWGEYWSEYFLKNHLYVKGHRKFVVMGNPDYYHNFKVLQGNAEPSCATYICQTFVEDGRMNRQDFINFIVELGDSLDSTFNLRIKLHPRSDLTLYKHLEKNSRIEFTRDFPKSEIYIGHYSSVLALVGGIEAPLLIHEFPGHPTPEYFSAIATEVSTSNETFEEAMKNLSRLIKMHNKQDSDKQKIDHYFMRTSKNPYSVPAEVITSLGHKELLIINE